MRRGGAEVFIGRLGRRRLLGGLKDYGVVVDRSMVVGYCVPVWRSGRHYRAVGACGIYIMVRAREEVLHRAYQKGLRGVMVIGIEGTRGLHDQQWCWV